MFELNGKKALVAGGAGYLGLPVSMKLAGQGADVVVADYNAGAAEKAASEIMEKVPKGKVSWLEMDVSDEESIKSGVRGAAGEAGRVDIMVNLAAAGSGKGISEITPGEFDRTLHINLTGGFILARECSGYMRKGGSIILYSSMYGRVAPDPGIYEEPMKPNPLDYGAAKAGIEQLVRYLAVSWGPRDIRVNGISPGPFPDVEKPAYVKDKGFISFVERLSEKVPMGRVGQREETAGAAVFLSSDEASFITGHTIVIDGGWTSW